MIEPQNTVIIDFGSRFCKVDAPRLERGYPFRIETIVGRPVKCHKSLGKDNQDLLIGDQIDDNELLFLNISEPMKNGLVQNWDDFERILHYIFFQELHITPEEHPIILTEKLGNINQRFKMAESLFESFNIPYLYIANPAYLAFQSRGRQTGMIADCGEDITQILKITDGNYNQYDVLMSNVAGRACTKYFTQLIQTKCNILSQYMERYSFQEYNFMRKTKENYCFVNLDDQDFWWKRKQLQTTEQLVSLPDGSTFNICQEKFQCPEVLFDPSLIGLETPGIHKMILKSYKDYREFFNYYYVGMIHLTGMTFGFQNIHSRLQQELVQLNPVMKNQLFSVDFEFLMLGTCLGGKILSSLSQFRNIAISRKQYNEGGIRVFVQ